MLTKLQKFSKINKKINEFIKKNKKNLLTFLKKLLSYI